VEIGDPGVDLLFDNAVYVRGAMTLQALRQTVGDDAFWRIIRGWASTKSGGNATTEEFIAFAEQVSGQQLDDLFTTWLFTPAKPALAGLAGSAAALSAPAGASATDWWQRAQAQHDRGRF
jgi:aminopeptidase N